MITAYTKTKIVASETYFEGTDTAHNSATWSKEMENLHSWAWYVVITVWRERINQVEKQLHLYTKCVYPGTILHCKITV